MRWNLEKRNIKDIQLDEKNPRYMKKNQASALKISLEKFGVCQPIVLNKDGTIIGGHQRFKILKRLGYDSIDVFISSKQLSQKEKDELSIRLNKNLGEWDFDVLANSWELEELLDWGFNMEEFHIESIPDKPKKNYIITIICELEEDFNFIEDRIKEFIDLLPTIQYKVKEK